MQRVHKIRLERKAQSLETLGKMRGIIGDDNGFIELGGLQIQINLVSAPEDPEAALRNAKLLNLAVRDDEVPN